MPTSVVLVPLVEVGHARVVVGERLVPLRVGVRHVESPIVHVLMMLVWVWTRYLRGGPAAEAQVRPARRCLDEDGRAEARKRTLGLQLQPLARHMKWALLRRAGALRETRWYESCFISATSHVGWRACSSCGSGANTGLRVVSRRGESTRGAPKCRTKLRFAKSDGGGEEE
ncbi:uncharacterized protein SOCE26_097630 [Sorangium cellulosum]|uniref:Uncharacterized protein n=1 Tax=Sorangium cellulosum TaxID=56 RepID=A0A2L0F9R6_SORCE|nr:uncharacterized protein SOCE26_097630 [Sorangium cellulosum]